MLKIKEDIIKIAKKVYERGYAPGVSGNVSYKSQNRILITSTGSCLGDLKNENIVEIDKDANLISGKLKPSSEKFLHTEIYSKRKDIKAIIHCHSPKLTTFSVINKSINDNSTVDLVYYFKEIPVAPYAIPSSKELIKNTIQYFDNHNVVIMQNHGVIVGAKTIQEAFYILETAENVAEISLNSMIANQKVAIPNEEVEKILSLR